jgi:hypothetical protein
VLVKAVALIHLDLYELSKLVFTAGSSHAQSVHLPYGARYRNGFRSRKNHSKASEVPDARPEPSKRLFNSTTVEDVIVRVSAKIQDETVRQIFANCLPSTLGKNIHSYLLNLSIGRTLSSKLKNILILILLNVTIK